MPTYLDDKIRSARAEATVLAEEARILQETSDKRAGAVQERARKATERLERLLHGTK
jgi:hypothetical protein